MRCLDCGQQHSRIFGHIDTMNPRSPLDWACIVGGALIALLLPLALVVWAGAIR